MQAMPSNFCWKKGDAGVIPKDCPEGFFRSAALCYKNCGDGFKFVGGVCWTVCKQGYTDIGALCSKGIRVYAKKSFVPSSITNFDSKVPCPKNMYRSGALCYRDCGAIGMYNCGIGACAGDKDSCDQQILDVSFSVIGAASGSATSVFQIDTPDSVKQKATATIKSYFSSTARVTLKNAYSQLKKILKTSLKESIITKAKNFLKTKNIPKSHETLVETGCKKFWDLTIEKINSDKDNQALLRNLGETVDIFSNSKITVSCKNSSEGSSNCQNAVSEKTSSFDSSGLLAFASAFMKIDCDI